MILTVLQQKIHMCIPSACNSMHDPSVMIVLLHTEWQEVAALEDRSYQFGRRSWPWKMESPSHGGTCGHLTKF